MLINLMIKINRSDLIKSIQNTFMLKTGASTLLHFLAFLCALNTILRYL